VSGYRLYTITTSICNTVVVVFVSRYLIDDRFVSDK